MADTKAVDIAGMKAAQPHFETALSETSNAFSNMSDQASTLQGSWTGDASQGFVAALHAWLDNCSLIQRELRVVTEKLAENTGGYVQTHTSTTDSANSIQQVIAAGLPGFSS